MNYDPAQLMAIMQALLSGGKRAAGGFTGNPAAALGAGANAFGAAQGDPMANGGTRMASWAPADPGASVMGQQVAPGGSPWSNEVTYSAGGARRPPLSAIARGGR